MSDAAVDFWKYLAISPLDESWGMVCTTVGYQSVSPQGHYPVSQHPKGYDPISSGRVLGEYQLVYIIDGSGYFESASTERTVIEPGTMIMLFPGEWHTYHPARDTGWSELWVGFRGAVADNLVARGFFTKKEPLCRIGISETLVGLYKDIVMLAGDQHNGCQQLIAGIIHHMIGLVHYKRHNSFYAGNSSADKIDRARVIMRENINGNLTAEDIAARVGMGYSWFRRAFREYAGTSPAQYRLQLRLARAKELLATSGLSLSEIAYELGFESISQFSAFFKKREGVTASEFRGKNSLIYRK